MFIAGIDLSGPSNIKDTALTCFQCRADYLHLVHAQQNVSDREIVDLIVDCQQQAGLVIGLDAPLSYNPGGGDHPADSELRKLIVKTGLRSGSVMTPTAPRMVYLTLRGLSLAHILSNLVSEPISIVETHPGAVLALHGAPIDNVVNLKSSKTVQNDLLYWLEQQGVQGAATLKDSGDHMIAACASAFGAWKWQNDESQWLRKADPPFHPFDFAC
jgi:predicted nuclease with RNAse H fold